MEANLSLIAEPGELSGNASNNWLEGSEGGNNWTEGTLCLHPDVGTCYVMDTSKFHGPLYFVSPLLGVIMPILACVTLVSNTIIIVILSRPGMQSPTNCVLLSMAVCDLTTILVPTPWYIYLYSLGHHGDTSWTPAGCFLYEVLSVTVPQVFHSASNWLTLALAVQRYIYVCHAAVAKQWCTLARSRLLVFLILGLAVTYMVPRVFDRTYDITNTDVGAPDPGKSVCLVHFSPWVTTLTLDVYFITFWWFRCLFVQLIPCVCLVILNILLFSAMRRAEQRRRRLTINKTKKEPRKPRVARTNTFARRMSIFGLTKESRDRRQRDANSTTMMLIVVIGVFLAVETPLAVLSALHTFSSSVKEFLDYQLVNNIILFINVIICLSYPLNFAIYCGMSRQFRKTFRSVFLSPVQKFLHQHSGHLGERDGGDEAAEGRDVNKSRTEASCNSTRMSKVTNGPRSTLGPSDRSTMGPMSDCKSFLTPEYMACETKEPSKVSFEPNIKEETEALLKADGPDTSEHNGVQDTVENPVEKDKIEAEDTTETAGLLTTNL